jgi:hypothetical protein
MKKCTICKDDKELSKFNKNKSRKDGHNNICKTCSQERSKRYYNENRTHHREIVYGRKLKLINENRIKLFEFYSTHPCIDCGQSDPIVLECDHRDDAEKIDNVSNLMDRCWETIQLEIDKCDVRCANCHRKRTAIQQGWYKWLIK